jgi:DMSO/TMAO reductase YedYZ molybdopterin-dependent catalytic subunit
MRLLALLTLLLGFALAQTEGVELTGLLNTPAKLSLADLQKLPAETLEVTFQSGQNTEKHTYKGVRLAALLNQAGLKLEERRKNDKLRKYVVVTAKDGYEVIVAWGELDPEFGNAPILLAWEEDGKALEGKNAPFRLVVPGDKRGGRYVSGVVRIEVRDVDTAPRQ